MSCTGKSDIPGWTGCYLGGYVGGAWKGGDASFGDLGNSLFAAYSAVSPSTGKVFTRLFRSPEMRDKIIEMMPTPEAKQKWANILDPRWYHTQEREWSWDEVDYAAFCPIR
ncbi:MAG TPA: hypothetical protein VH678_14190 [Xanthobacteraceae bacterium]|jgi:hypothetical protein